MSKNYLNQRNKVEDFLFKSKFDYENDLVRLNMDKEKKVKEIISKYK